MSYLIVRFLYLFGSHTSTDRVFLSLHDFHRKFFYILLILLLGPITGLFVAQCFHRRYLVRVLVIIRHTQFGTILITGSLLLYIFYCIIKYVHSLVHGQDQTTVLQSILVYFTQMCANYGLPYCYNTLACLEIHLQELWAALAMRHISKGQIFTVTGKYSPYPFL